MSPFTAEITNTLNDAIWDKKLNAVSPELLTVENLTRLNAEGESPLFEAITADVLHQVPWPLFSPETLSLPVSKAISFLALLASFGGLNRIPRYLLNKSNLTSYANSTVSPMVAGAETGGINKFPEHLVTRETLTTPGAKDGRTALESLVRERNFSILSDTALAGCWDVEVNGKLFNAWLPDKERERALAFKSKRKVLLVDDDWGQLELMTAIYNDETEFGVGVVLSGEEALIQLKEFQYSLVITDLDRPHEDIHEFIKQVKTSCPTIPIVAVTGFEPHPSDSEWDVVEIARKCRPTEELIALLRHMA